ncbi:hypothetical protein A3224_06570 [Microbulbifer thermotolerans]|uniref:Uncharacterized protein n=1 Tax=Microbulbifer thermotolerans TaxID=252514 RepID=A0A143HLZ8_MICTH|nr:hypothetical protein A3224_06570 [Microbulbifer thermotolerans]
MEVSSKTGIVIPEAVVVISRLTALYLPRKPQIYNSLHSIAIRISIRCCLPKRITIPAPDNNFITISSDTRRVQVVCVQISQGSTLNLPFAKGRYNLCYRHVIQVDVVSLALDICAVGSDIGLSKILSTQVVVI